MDEQQRIAIHAANDAAWQEYSQRVTAYFAAEHDPVAPYLSREDFDSGWEAGVEWAAARAERLAEALREIAKACEDLRGSNAEVLLSILAVTNVALAEWDAAYREAAGGGAGGSQ